jgi:group I intron endonuclease
MTEGLVLMDMANNIQDMVYSCNMSDVETLKTWRFAGIYGIRHIESGKIYIGQSQNIARRIATHKRLKDTSCVHVLYAIRKYGVSSFVCIVFEVIGNLLLLTEREQYFMDYFESYKPKNGYNICPIAESTRGRKHTEETKNKIRIAHLGIKLSEEHKAKIGVAFKGIKLSEEHKTKIGIAGKGRIRVSPSIETRNKISLSHMGIKRNINDRGRIAKQQRYLWIKNQIYEVTNADIVKQFNVCSETARNDLANFRRLNGILTTQLEIYKTKKREKKNQRLTWIVSMNGNVTTKQIAQRFGISLETANNDLRDFYNSDGVSVSRPIIKEGFCVFNTKKQEIRNQRLAWITNMNGNVTVEQIVQQFGVTPRTAYRDLQAYRRNGFHTVVKV